MMSDKELFCSAMTARFGEAPKIRRFMHNGSKIQEMANSRATVWLDAHDSLVGIMVWPKG